MRPCLVLFDIDGTLVSTGGRAGNALVSAIAETFGTVGPLEGYRYSGKTDPQIIRELLAGSGVPREQVERRLDDVCRRYLELLEEALPPGTVTVLAGVRDVLAELSTVPGVHVGLLTGNLVGGAGVKLRAAGLEAVFAVGAYGSDNADRNFLVPVARARARAHWGIDFPGRATIVVGDAEADIHCARAGDATSVAVASGWTPRETLAALEPDVLLDSLAESGAASMIHGHSDF